MDSSKRFVTVVLALGALVLVLAILLGERMGSRVLGSAVEERTNAVQALAITPGPQESAAVPYGPDWKRSQALAAAGDPGFPDPRVPPEPLPTPLPATPSPKPTPKWSVNPNIPIWRQPSPSPSASSSSSAAPRPTPTPVDGPSIPPP